jgi:glycosyltransferase involved in cell wall biosynthesis
MPRIKVLWLSHFVPFPPKGGAFQRSYNLLRYIGSEHEVHLIALRHKEGTHPESETADAKAELERHCASVTIIDGRKATTRQGLLLRGLMLATATPLTVSISDCAEMHREIQRAVRATDFDVVHFDSIGLGCYKRDIGELPSVLVHHGAESFMMLRRIQHESSLLRRAVFNIEGRVLRGYEARMCRRYSTNVVVSSFDQQLLTASAGPCRYVVVANGVDTQYFEPTPDPGTHSLIFAGRLDQYSNRDAILHFMREAWPLVKRRFTDATIDIIGNLPPPELLALADRDASIRVHGFVPDVRPFFAGASIAVCPIRNGGGTRIKILDNFAMGKAVVSTSIGTEGLDVTAGRDLLIADDPRAFADRIDELFTDSALREQLRRNARLLAETTYSWDKIGGSLTEAYVEAMANTSVNSLR